MTKIFRVRYVHKNFVVFLQLVCRSEVTLCCPGVIIVLRTEPCSVGIHEGQGCGVSHPPHKHRVLKWRGGFAVLKDQLHSRVNVVESGLVDLQSAIFHPVRHSTGREGLACLWLPAQSLSEYNFFNAPWQSKDETLQNVDVGESQNSAHFNRRCYLSRVQQVWCFCLLLLTQAHKHLKQHPN